VSPLSSDKPGVVLETIPPPCGLKEEALRSVCSLPPFPPILTRLLAALAAEEVSYSLLGDLIEKDTVMAANILHLVNSGEDEQEESISSVRLAISLLGATKLHNAVLGMSSARVWNRTKMPASWSMARFNLHSSAVALLSDLLAQRLELEYPEGAFMAGLLHDSGRLLIALALPQEYERILELHAAGDRPVVDCEREILGFTHAELSSEALKYWKLPKEIQIAVRDHHGSRPESRGEIPLSYVVDAADQYANSAGLSILAQSLSDADFSGSYWDAADASVLQLPGLDAMMLQALVAEFRTESDAMGAYFR
jgi:HD-like signal output (HDOD) protein